MKRFLFIIGCLLWFNGIAQQSQVDETMLNLPLSARVYDSVAASHVPVLLLSGDALNKLLPSSVDNSKNLYFPNILDQYTFFSCQQHTGVAYTFSYEMNRLRHIDSKLEQNRYPTHYTWNYMNEGDRWTGVGFFYSWDVLKQQGHPTLNDYGGDTLGRGIAWMNGYDKYYRGMKNRLKSVHSIPTNTPEGILTLKQYLFDHLDGSSTGGIATFGASGVLTSVNFKKIPAGTPEEGKNIITGFYPNATHGMTIVGYNDSIRYDLNGDGYYTNNLDINNDGIVDVQDWEIGAFKMANSHGQWWGDNGYGYIMYHAMALYYGNNPDFWDPVHGIWNHCVYTLEPDPDYEPKLTLKVNITHDVRNKISIKAGVSSDTTSQFPEHLLSFPIYNFQGAEFGMQGVGSTLDKNTIELGLDVTPLLSFIEPGQAATFFLVIDENDPEQVGHGTINQLSFIDYTNGIREMACSESAVSIRNNDLTVLKVQGGVAFNKVNITTSNLPSRSESTSYPFQLQASGGTQPYQWTLLYPYEKRVSTDPFPQVTQQPLYYESVGVFYRKVALPFSFPFYGKKYDTAYINAYGFIAFEATQLPYMYLRDEEGMINRSKILSPAFSFDYLLNYGQKGVWMESSSNEVTFRWRLRIFGYDTSQYANFALKIKANGDFQFLYGNMPSVDPIFTTWAGCSNGDEINHITWPTWNSAGLSGKGFQFHPLPLPEGISLTETGELNVASADSGNIYELRFRVADRDHILSEKQFVLSPGIDITQEVVSGVNNCFSCGDTSYFRLKVKNNTSGNFHNLQIKLNSSDSSVLISDSIITIETLAPGNVMTIDKGFSFSQKHPLPDQTPVDFTFTITDTTHRWLKEFYLPVCVPSLIVKNVEVNDGYDRVLDPGEVADLVINLQNVGSISTDSLIFSLTSVDTLIRSISIPVIDTNTMAAHARNEVKFTLHASPFAQCGSKTNLIFSVNDNHRVNMTAPISLTLGKLPLLLVNLADDSSSNQAMKTALNDLNVNYSSLNYFPENVSDYEALFITAGTGINNSHLITNAEGDIIANYLLQGGKVYLESNVFWYNQKKNRAHSFFSYTSSILPSWYYSEVKGVSSTFSEDMHFIYTHPVNYSRFTLDPVFPAYASFMNLDNPAKSVEVVYNEQDYKTIGSLLEFGSLSDGNDPSKKKTLMRKYLDIFELELPGPSIFFHSDKNSICPGNSISFHDDTYDATTSRLWEFAGGTPSTSTDKNPVVIFAQPGSYNVKLTASDGINSRTIIKHDYIKVNVCTNDEKVQSSILVKVFPNPASNHIHILFNSNVEKSNSYEFYDFMGRKMSGWKMNTNRLQEKEIEFDVSSFPVGIYIFSVRTVNGLQSQKFIIQK